MWEIVNRDRRRARRVNERIKREEWEEYFMRLLGNVEIRMVRGEERGNKEEDEEESISGGEIKGAIRRLKDDKAVGTR